MNDSLLSQHRESFLRSLQIRDLTHNPKVDVNLLASAACNY